MDYSHMKAQLEERKREIEQRLINNKQFGLERGFASDTRSGELSQYDNHPADSGTELFEREKDMALLDHLEEELEEVKYSLDQIEKGTYGTCEVTGQQIPYERLEAYPTARTVIEHAEQSVPKDRSVEEAVLKEIDQDDNRDTNPYQQAASFNESSMTYDDSSIMEEDEASGYSEEFEPFVSTDIHGYTGQDNIHLEHNLHYDKYKEAYDDAEQEEQE
ncbi:TraR/DksA C4-type zinc finger protein [Halobacillus sp. Marseille-Q1614]|uniref:TraR/DksA C4-type zinc finger protein n=1 Tax=Halobacillus sp. Marseille-Q1614 TaxID=2709134 RepID=UPI00156E5AC7|nr:TraR/DksA C4-type zinc finger protein [Halobacillus sp. Marseille-Q1614]